MNDDEILARLLAHRDGLEALRQQTGSPAIATALRHAVYYCHIAAGFAGHDGFGPEVERDLAGEGEAP